MQLLLPNQIGNCDAQRAALQREWQRAFFQSIACTMLPRRDGCRFRDLRRVPGRAQDAR